VLVKVSICIVSEVRYLTVLTKGSHELEIRVNEAQYLQREWAQKVQSYRLLVDVKLKVVVLPHEKHDLDEVEDEIKTENRVKHNPIYADPEAGVPYYIFQHNAYDESENVEDTCNVVSTLHYLLLEPELEACPFEYIEAQDLRKWRLSANQLSVEVPYDFT
jgi:hypothetical protein